MWKSTAELFKARHLEQEIIILYVRWILRYKLSSTGVIEIMAERGLAISYTTILRWIQRFVPEVEKRWNRYAGQAGITWRGHETYVKTLGSWPYLYRPVDCDGNMVDFRLSARHDVAAAQFWGPICTTSLINVQGIGLEVSIYGDYQRASQLLLALAKSCRPLHGQKPDVTWQYSTAFD
jgi:hypothetical protein